MLRAWGLSPIETLHHHALSTPANVVIFNTLLRGMFNFFKEGMNTNSGKTSEVLKTSEV